MSLRGDNLSTTTACDASSKNLVVATSPMVANIASTTPQGGNLVLTGTTVNLRKLAGRPRNGYA